MDLAEVTRNYLLYLIMPLWVAVGLADWLCHRASNIAQTSGAKESVLHLTMMGEAGFAVLLGLFFEINSLVLVLMLIALILHEATAFWDVSYAHRRREVSPIEQRVHDYLGALPFMAFSFVLVLHWPEARKILIWDFLPGDWSLRWKEVPLPLAYIAMLLAAIAALNILPFVEELLRGLRQRAAALARR